MNLHGCENPKCVTSTHNQTVCQYVKRGLDFTLVAVQCGEF